MLILTHNLYPFVNAALKDAGHTVVTADSHKLEKMRAKYSPDRTIIFGWDKNCIRFMMKELNTLTFPQAGSVNFLDRSEATKSLDDLLISGYPWPTRYYIKSGLLSQNDDYKKFLDQHDREIKTWVMKWGNAHQGKDKRQVTFPHLNLPFNALPRENVILEPFVEGRSIRILVINGKIWKIEHVNRKNWIKNIDPDEEILNPLGVSQIIIDQALRVAQHHNLGLVAVDFQVGVLKTVKDQILPLEINIMPGIPEDDGVRKAYAQYFLDIVK